MAKWFFEPGHTAAEFCVRHMMVTYVRGHFKNVRGTLKWDPDRPGATSVEVEIDARNLWSGEPDRDAHLKSADFLDVENHPSITFQSAEVVLIGEHDFVVIGDLTVRGATRRIALRVSYLGSWQTPWWEDGVDQGPKTRAGFVATAQVNRHDFGVSWDSPLSAGGSVVGGTVEIVVDAEAILGEAEVKPPAGQPAE
jgi:polyisoprenoid-binding protein YceI